MSDKEIELAGDLLEEGLSECCGAEIYLDICSKCKEHCDPFNEEEQ